MFKSLTYVSVASVPVTKSLLRNILASSLKNNKSLEITGMLVYYDSTFIQVLEGFADHVSKIFEVISKDERHDNVVVLNEAEIEEREMGNGLSLY